MNFMYLNHGMVGTSKCKKIIAVKAATYTDAKPWPLWYQRIAFNHFIFIFRGYMYIMKQFMTSSPLAYRVVKSSRLLAKIAAYLVISIGRLLFLAFLYGWHFLNKISLDWLLTLTTQPSTLYLKTLWQSCLLAQKVRALHWYCRG